MGVAPRHAICQAPATPPPLGSHRMPQDNADDRNQDSGAEQPNVPLDPNANRDQLLKKLNCLIAVLEAAIQKVRKNQHDGTADPRSLGADPRESREHPHDLPARQDHARETWDSPGEPPPRSATRWGSPLRRSSRRVSRRAARAIAPRTTGGCPTATMSSSPRSRSIASSEEMPAIRLDEVQSVDFDQLASDLGKLDD